MSYRNRLALGMESSINFQSTVFFKELAGALEAARSLNKKDLADSDEIQHISKVVKNHTGLKLVVQLYDGDGAYVMIPKVDRNHPLVQNYVRNYITSETGIRMIQDAGKVIRGSVDQVTGKVSGVFEEIETSISIGTGLMTNKYTSEEVAAVLAHEIGHLISYFGFIARSVTTNQILAGMAKALDESGDIRHRETVLMTVKQEAKLKDLDVAELAKSGNNKVVEVVVISNMVKETQSELKVNAYDTTTWEMLADQYVARLGGSRHLVTALDKMYRGMWNISFRSLPAFLAFEAFKLLMIISPPVMIALIVMDGNGDGSYDRPGARFKRVRNQVVEQLKDKKLSKDDVERLEADLACIDEVISMVNDRRQFLEVVWDFLSPSSRKERNYELLQKDLEGLAANDLFTKAASLRNL